MMMSMQIPNTDTMKFGPEWLQQMNESSNVGGAGATTTPLSTKLITSKSSVYSRTRLHGRQYGVEKLISIWSNVLTLPPELQACPDILVTDPNHIVSPITLRNALEVQKQQDAAGQRHPYSRGRGSGTVTRGGEGPLRGAGGSVPRGFGRRQGHVAGEEIEADSHHHGGLRSVSQSSSARGRGRGMVRGAHTSHGHHERVGELAVFETGGGGDEEDAGAEGGGDDQDDSSGEWQQVGSGGRMRQISHNSVDSGTFETTGQAGEAYHHQTHHNFSRQRSAGHTNYQTGATGEAHQAAFWRQRQRTKSGGDKQAPPHPFHAPSHSNQQQRRIFYTPAGTAQPGGTDKSSRPTQHQRSYSGDSFHEGEEPQQQRFPHGAHPHSNRAFRRSRTNSRNEDVVLEDFFEDLPANPTSKSSSNPQQQQQRKVQLVDGRQFQEEQQLEENKTKEEEDATCESKAQSSSAAALDVGRLVTQLKMLATTTGGIEKMDDNQLKEVLQRVLTSPESSSTQVLSKDNLPVSSSSEKLVAAPPQSAAVVVSNPNCGGAPSSYVALNASLLDSLEKESSSSGNNRCAVVPPPLLPVQWFYLDPKGNEQGPFPSSSMWQWFENGYFPDTLYVKRTCDPRYLTLKDFKLLYRCNNPFVDSLGPSQLPLSLSDDVLGGTSKDWPPTTSHPHQQQQQPMYPSHLQTSSTARYIPPVEAAVSSSGSAAAMQQLFSALVASAGDRGALAAFTSPASEHMLSGGGGAPGFRRSVSVTAAPQPPRLGDAIMTGGGIGDSNATSSVSSFQLAAGAAYSDPMKSFPVMNSNRLMASEMGVSAAYHTQPPQQLPPNSALNRSFSNHLPSSTAPSSSAAAFLQPLSTGGPSIPHQAPVNRPDVNDTSADVGGSTSIESLNPAIRDFVTNSSIWSTTPQAVGAPASNHTTHRPQACEPPLFDLTSLGESHPPKNLAVGSSHPPPAAAAASLHEQSAAMSTGQTFMGGNSTAFTTVAGQRKQKKGQQQHKDADDERQKRWEDSYRNDEQAQVQRTLREEEERHYRQQQQEQEAAAALEMKRRAESEEARQRAEEEQRRLLAQMPELPVTARWGAGSGGGATDGVTTLLSIQQQEQLQAANQPPPPPLQSMNDNVARRPVAWASSTAANTHQPAVTPTSHIPTGKSLAEIQAEELRKEEARQREERELAAALAAVRESESKMRGKNAVHNAPLWASKVKQSLPPGTSSSQVNVVVASPTATLPLTSVPHSAPPPQPPAGPNTANLVSIWGAPTPGAAHNPTQKTVTAPVTPAPSAAATGKGNWPSLASGAPGSEFTSKPAARSGGKASGVVSSQATTSSSELDALKSVMAQSRPSNPLTEWAKTRVRELFSGGSSGVLDLGTLIDITSDMRDESEVTDMFKEYLGNSEQVRAFSTEFLERRREMQRSGTNASGWVTASHKGSTKTVGSSATEKSNNSSNAGGAWQTAGSKSGPNAISGAVTGGKKKKKTSQGKPNQSVRIL